MRQHISIEQLNELSDDAKRNLYTWQKKKGYHREGEVDWDDYWENSTMSIGQMIEFLGRDYPEAMIENYYDGMDCPNYYFPDELCDVLWEKVKEKLEGQV